MARGARGCRDCSRCSRSFVGKVAAGPFRIAGNVSTLGTVTALRKKCGVCGHPIGAHADKSSFGIPPAIPARRPKALIADAQVLDATALDDEADGVALPEPPSHKKAGLWRWFRARRLWQQAAIVLAGVYALAAVAGGPAKIDETSKQKALVVATTEVSSTESETSAAIGSTIPTAVVLDTTAVAVETEASDTTASSLVIEPPPPDTAPVFKTVRYDAPSQFPVQGRKIRSVDRLLAFNTCRAAVKKTYPFGSKLKFRNPSESDGEVNWIDSSDGMIVVSNVDFVLPDTRFGQRTWSCTFDFALGQAEALLL